MSDGWVTRVQSKSVNHQAEIRISHGVYPVEGYRYFFDILSYRYAASLVAINKATSWSQPLVLATGPKCRVGSRSGSTRTRTVATGLTTPKTQTIGNGAVLPPKTRHLKLTILAPIKYLSSDRITTWSVCRLCSFGRSFTSRFQICDLTSIRWVTIENPPISLKITHYFATTQRISVGSQIWKREVKERVRLHNLRTDHVVIRSELKDLIGAKGVGTVYLELWSGSNPAKYLQFYVRSG